MIRIVIVADTAARAQAVAHLLADDDRLDVLDASGSPVLETADGDAFDVLVVVGPSPHPLTAHRRRIVVVSDAPLPHAALGSQVHAWLSFKSSAEELSAAIFAAACDLTVFTPDQLHSPQQRARDHNEDNNLVEKLTPRELQVLRLLARGLGNKEIAGQLGLSDHTAKFHVAQILAKLGAGSRTEAVSLGIRRGLLPI